MYKNWWNSGREDLLGVLDAAESSTLTDVKTFWVRSPRFVWKTKWMISRKHDEVFGQHNCHTSVSVLVQPFGVTPLNNKEKHGKTQVGQGSCGHNMPMSLTGWQLDLVWNSAVRLVQRCRCITRCTWNFVFTTKFQIADIRLYISCFPGWCWPQL